MRPWVRLTWGHGEWSPQLAHSMEGMVLVPCHAFAESRAVSGRQVALERFRDMKTRHVVEIFWSSP